MKRDTTFAEVCAAPTRDICGEEGLTRWKLHKYARYAPAAADFICRSANSA